MLALTFKRSVRGLATVIFRQLAAVGATLIMLVGCGDGNGGSPDSACNLDSPTVSEYCAQVAAAVAQIQESQALVERFRTEQQQAPPSQLADLTANQLNQYTQRYPGASVAELIAAQQEVQRQKDAEILRHNQTAAAWEQFWAARAESAARWTQELRDQSERDAALQQAYEQKREQDRLERERAAAALVTKREQEFNYYQDEASEDRLDAARRAELNP